MARSEIGEAIRDTLANSRDEVNVVDALASITRALILLGNAGAGPMGAVEAHGKAITDSADQIAGRLGDIVDALNNVAQAIREGHDGEAEEWKPRMPTAEDLKGYLEEGQ